MTRMSMTEGLDERQRHARGEAANIAFFGLLVALVVNLGINEAGGTWGTVGQQTIALVWLGLTVYLVQVVWRSAYSRAEDATRRVLAAFGLCSVLDLFVLVTGGEPLWSHGHAGGGFALTAMCVGFVAVTLTAAARLVADRCGDED